ncbi:MAG: histidine kinase-, DNA gyrase B-, and HSP90-like ATPase [halophilic archaeon J07HX5]|nr:MAG: histidine kinase-, DNA gyrase B-, and HSP90-like ATPase [halophilic archaeon J07HX5]
MISTVGALFVSVTIAGVVLCLIAISSYRRCEAPGTRSFGVFGVVLGVGFALSGVVGVVFGVDVRGGQSQWVSVGFLGWALASVPWLVFTAQYTGQQLQVGWRTMLALVVPLTGFAGQFVVGDSLGAILSSLSIIYALGIVIVGASLLMRATQSYVELGALDGLLVVALPVTVPLVLNFSGFLSESSVELLVGTYTTTVAGGTALLGLAVFSRSVFDHTPATERLGRRTISSETADLIFIVNDDGTIIRRNAAVAETLRSPPPTGQQLTTAVGHSATTLRTTETVSLTTVTGTRQYDPQVSPITDATDGRLGAVISLRDVTDRRVRRQRLTVLNRVLRHNLRNEVDVIKGHTEELATGKESGHAAAVVAAAERISGLGDTARNIDEFVSAAAETETIDLAELVSETRAAIETETDVSVGLAGPETAVVRTNRQALRGALKSAVENAIEHGASTVELAVEPTDDGYEVVVSDDGAGIPQRDRELIDTGTETPLRHGIGLELWRLNWAVAAIGGRLSFDTRQDATVQFTVPNRVGRS